MWSFCISVLSTFTKFILTRESTLLENNIAHLTEALESLCVEEESVPLKQSSAKWSKEFEKQEKSSIVSQCKLILHALSNETFSPNKGFRAASIRCFSQTWWMFGYPAGFGDSPCVIHDWIFYLGFVLVGK